MVITYKAATQEEITPIFQQCKQLIDRYEDLDTIDYPMVLNWMRRKIEKKLHEYQVIYADGQKAGYYRFCRNQDSILEIDDLYIFPEFQNQGIGTGVFKRCCDGVHEPIMFYVFSKNTRAIALYKRLGFAITEKVGTTRYIMKKIPKNRIVDKDITLVKYYPNYKTALAWYQDPGLCKQVDNRDTVYDLALLKAMYRYLDRHGDLFYIKYKNRLCGDVCLQPDGEINIVVAKPFQNKHIGRRVVQEIIRLAKEKNIEKLHATIYPFNTQSQRMFEQVGFQKIDAETYVLSL